jgi:hypothetical protein
MRQAAPGGTVTVEIRALDREEASALAVVTAGVFDRAAGGARR